MVVELKQMLDDNFKRSDYKEVVELSLFLLDEDCHINFKKPGARHHARWMSSFLYFMKMAAFGEKLYNADFFHKIQQISLFYTLFLILPWLKANDTLNCAFYDLKFINQVNTFSKFNPTVSDTALKVFYRHSWFLSEELSIFTLFSEQFSQRDIDDGFAKLNNCSPDLHTGKPILQPQSF